MRVDAREVLLGKHALDQHRTDHAAEPDDAYSFHFSLGATLALLRQFLAARSIIDVAMTPRKLTGQAQSSIGKPERRCHAALLTGRAKSAGLAGSLRWGCAAIADRDLLLPKTGGVV
jgi:hypothetical protein